MSDRTDQLDALTWEDLKKVAKENGVNITSRDEVTAALDQIKGELVVPVDDGETVAADPQPAEPSESASVELDEPDVVVPVAVLASPGVRWFHLKDGLGLDGLTGEEAPIAEVGLRIAVPAMVQGNVVHDLR